VNKILAALFTAVAVAFAPVALAATPPAGPITLPAKPGNVTFEHSKHSQHKCTVCHASMDGGPIQGFNKTVSKDTAHGKCHECHKKEGKGPQKCADCHKKA
jgi:hypothetical protein